MLRKTLFQIILFSLALLLSGCGSNSLLTRSSISSPPASIALLLPLQGNLSAEANAIRNGFFAAYYAAKEQQANAPTVMVLDTSQGSIAQIYQQAIARGANLVVGPLSKNELAQLAKTASLTIPTLALNTLPELRAHPISNLYQFSLSPLDDAQQVAEKAWSDNHRTALIIAPANAWGQPITQALLGRWQGLGGQIAGQMLYSSQENLAQQVASLLNIDQAAEAHANRLKHLYNKKTDFVPAPRTTADVIFLIAQPTMARQIKPLLNYYFAQNIPVYATSTVFTGLPNSNNDRDLNGIIFPDMPWIITPQNMPANLLAIQQRIQTLWTTSYFQNPKLYAFGVDAYNTAVQLGHVNGMEGATGTLSLTPNQFIYRKLVWAQFINGIPQKI